MSSQGHKVLLGLFIPSQCMASVFFCLPPKSLDANITNQGNKLKRNLLLPLVDLGELSNPGPVPGPLSLLHPARGHLTQLQILP
ncbi:unnamed protein product [Lota lota]